MKLNTHEEISRLSTSALLSSKLTKIPITYISAYEKET